MDYPDTWSFRCIFFAHPGISHFRDWQFSIALGNLMVSRWPYMYLPWLHVLRWARNIGVFNLRLCGNWTNTNLLKWWATMCSWNTNCEILWCALYYVVSGLTAIGCTCSAAENIWKYENYETLLQRSNEFSVVDNFVRTHLNSPLNFWIRY